MNPIQIGAIVVGALVILSYFVNFKELFTKMSSSQPLEKPIDQTINIPDVAVSGTSSPKLSDIVHQWEKLKTMCQFYRLGEADQKLEEVFPLFIKRDKQ
jgi:hypothetical protein